MEDFFGLHPSSSSVVAYSDHHHLHQNNISMPTSFDHDHDYQNLLMSSVASSRDHHRIPIFGSDHHHHQMLSAAGACESSASIVAPAAVIHGGDDEITAEIKAKVASHPRYPSLLQAYIDCQKVGAPPEVACLLDEIRQESDLCKRNAVSSRLGVDPELDDFMETYCDMLIKYKSDLARPFNEATTFLNKIEMQLTTLCNKPLSRTSASADEVAGSSDEEFSGGEVEIQDFQTRVEDRDLKDKLLRKYSGYISSLKQEFSKKKKKGKLPKEARQTLLDWWTRHYRWPYPTEGDKIALAEATGLDQKQINNWFINQRKRHWKPSENMQYAIMDSLSAPLFIDD